jgi:hypothetical protein
MIERKKFFSYYTVAIVMLLFKQKIEAKKSEKNAVGKKSTRMSFFLFLLSFFKTPEKKSDRDVDVKNCEKNHSSNCCSKKVYCF